MALVAVSGARAETPLRKSVLILLADPPGRPMSTAVLEGIQSEIHAADLSIAISTDFIPQVQPDVTGFEATRLEWYKAKYHGVRFDAIIVFGPQPLRALVPWRQALWPDVPVVFCGISPGAYRELVPQTGFTGVYMATDLATNLRIYHQLLPGVKRLALVGGASPADHAFNAAVPRVLRETGS